ncbi:hypothetical protein RHGRI_035933 [Rhododendron griersonianum]|uniref:HAT C-terminal dimerisation domain-containing protein n=1 Tax=Rhododendron griersonianum TaxID=479676 RepID=A0AAV6HRG6_9ERIC|nr:hypothetical protein RHGRI_035933 [Rhododendron griersonianum]
MKGSTAMKRLVGRRFFVTNCMSFLKDICSTLLELNSSTMAQRPSCGTPDCDTRDDLEGFDTFTSRLVGPSTSKSQLDIYLEESRLNRREHENLNVLGFWKEQCHRFPELSLMACDILIIPITTVASESAFSIGGRILGKYRSSLLPQNAEVTMFP